VNQSVAGTERNSIPTSIRASARGSKASPRVRASRAIVSHVTLIIPLRVSVNCVKNSNIASAHMAEKAQHLHLKGLAQFGQRRHEAVILVGMREDERLDALHCIQALREQRGDRT